MAPFMRKYEAETYALMRIVVGLLLLWHGTSKLFDFPQDAPLAPAFIIYVAGSIEFVGGVLVCVGFFTRWAAFICSGLMAAAYWMPPPHGAAGHLTTRRSRHRTRGRGPRSNPYPAA